MKKGTRSRGRPHVAPRKRPAFMAPPRPAPSRTGSYQSEPAFTAPPVEELDDDATVDDQMDWMSSKLQQLIAEGQKALGKEIVVGADTGDDDDLVDDGDQAWGDEDILHTTSVPMKRGQSSGSGRSSPRKSRQSSPSKRLHASCQSLSLSQTSSRSIHRPSQSLTYAPFDETRRPAPLAPITVTSTFNELYTPPTPHGRAEFSREAAPDLQLAMQRVRQAYGLNP